MLVVVDGIIGECYKKPLEYLKTIFMWVTIPYTGWKVIHGDEDIVNEHWFMKVINN